MSFRAVVWAAAMLMAVQGQAPAVNVPAVSVPAVSVPGRGQQAQPMPAPAGPQLQPGQFLPAIPPSPGLSPGPGAGAVAPPPGPAGPSAVPVAPVQTEWVAQGVAELRGVDKVMARTSTLTAKVGETVRFGPLSVLVRHCVIRPPDRPQDAAAFLEISETARGEAGRPPVFRGWMLVSLPQLALVEHATHDIRLAACRP